LSEPGHVADVRPAHRPAAGANTFIVAANRESDRPVRRSDAEHQPIVGDDLAEVTAALVDENVQLGEVVADVVTGGRVQPSVDHAGDVLAAAVHQKLHRAPLSK
jgi:hypothetical protein